MSTAPTTGSGTRIGGHAPPLTGYWSATRIDGALMLSQLPALALASYLQRCEFLWPLATAVAVSLAWRVLFAIVRGGVPGWDCLLAAGAFALLVPASTPLWQQALALSFGVVIGEQVFGGRGWSFVNPVVVALAFLLFSFPGLDLTPTGPWLAAAALPGALLLLACRLLSMRLLAGIIAGIAGTQLLSGAAANWAEIASGTMVFGVIFLAVDPATSPATNWGRWLGGFLSGALVVVFGQGSAAPGSVHALAFALLVGSIFVPLIDRACVARDVRRRRMRNG